METLNDKKKSKIESKKINTAGIRVTKEIRRDLARLLDKINKKQFGKKIKASQVIAVAIKLIEEKHIQELQQSSYSNADKIEMQYREYVRQNGAISKDQYLGKLHELMLGNMSQSQS